MAFLSSISTEESLSVQGDLPVQIVHDVHQNQRSHESAVQLANKFACCRVEFILAQDTEQIRYVADRLAFLNASLRRAMCRWDGFDIVYGHIFRAPWHFDWALVVVVSWNEQDLV